MSLRVVAPTASPPTSAEGAMRVAARPQLTFVICPLSTSGTAAGSLPIEDWVGVLRAEHSTNSGTGAAGERAPFDTAAAVADLRRLSGLTWAQLARVFGVARRSLHFWASGKPINAANEERLCRLLAVLRQADRGSAQENRAVLLRDHDGVMPIDLLAAGGHDEFLALVGTGHGRRPVDPTPLSRGAQNAGRPLPSEDLVDALQDRVHRDVGRGRAARTVRGEPRGRDG